MNTINGRPFGTSKGRGRPSKYHFGTMCVGDYFDMPRDMGATSRHSDRRQHSISNSARKYMRKHPEVTFQVCCIDKDTVRCTRTK